MVIAILLGLATSLGLRTSELNARLTEVFGVFGGFDSSTTKIFTEKADGTDAQSNAVEAAAIPLTVILVGLCISLEITPMEGPRRVAPLTEGRSCLTLSSARGDFFDYRRTGVNKNDGVSRRDTRRARIAAQPWKAGLDVEAERKRGYRLLLAIAD